MNMSPHQRAVIDGLTAARIDYFLHVPGGPLAPIIAHFSSDAHVTELPLSREEEGIGILGGLVLGGRRAALMMQDNGLGNAGGVLCTFARAYHLPGLILSVRRGGRTEYNSAMHYFTEHVPAVLDALGIKSFRFTAELAPEQWALQLPQAYQHSLVTHRPVVALLELEG